MRQAIFGCCVKCGHFISYTHLQSVILLVAWLIAGLYAASAASSVSEFFLFVFFVFFANQSSLLIVLLNLGLCCRRTTSATTSHSSLKLPGYLEYRDNKSDGEPEFHAKFNQPLPVAFLCVVGGAPGCC